LIFWLALVPAALAVLMLAIGIQEPKETQEKVAASPLKPEALRSLGRQYWTLVLVAFLFNLGNSSDAFLLLKAQNIGIAAPYVPLVLVVMNVSYAISSYPCGLLSDKVGRFYLLVSGFVLYIAVYAGFAYADKPWQIWVLLAIYGIYLGLSQGNLLAFVSDTVPQELRGTAFGAINVATGTALLPASLMAGALWQRVSPSAAFLAGSAFAALALMIFLFTVKPDRKQAHHR
jgi:MFS family permease